MVVLSFFPLVEADFSFPAEAELDAARAEPAVLEPALAWLLASVEEERVCFEAEALAADALVAELVAGVAAEALVADAAVAVLAADAPAAELVAGAAAAVLVADAAVVLAADALAAEPVAGAAAAELGPACSALAVVLVADEPAVEPVAGAAAAELEPACSELVAALAAGALAAELVAGARVVDWRVVGCDWAAVELGQELAARRAVRWAVGCDSAEHFAEPQPADGRRWAVVAARRWVVRPLARGVEPERGALELPRRWVCLAGSAGPLPRRRACRD
jgi:hypothetical protein